MTNLDADLKALLNKIFMDPYNHVTPSPKAKAILSIDNIPNLKEPTFKILEYTVNRVKSKLHNFPKTELPSLAQYLIHLENTGNDITDLSIQEG